MSCSNRDRELLAEFVRQQLGQMLAEAEGFSKIEFKPNLAAPEGSPEKARDDASKLSWMKPTNVSKSVEKNLKANKKLTDALQKVDNKDAPQTLDLIIKYMGKLDPKKTDKSLDLFKRAKKKEREDVGTTNTSTPTTGANPKGMASTGSSSTQSTTPTKLPGTL